MEVADYLRDVLVPANVAVEAISRAGLPVDLDRLRTTGDAWLKEIEELEARVEGEFAKRGSALEFTEKHGLGSAALAEFLFGTYGLKLPPGVAGVTEKGNPSTADEVLSHFASLSIPRPGDDPLVRDILQIRSLSGGKKRYLDAFERSRMSDGCCHPKFNWTLRTARLSAENPPVHGIPESADRRVADGIKACIVPRVSPARSPDEWDPRKHGSCFRWDISGAEAAIRAAMFTDHYGVRDPIAWEYIRLGKDIHSKTASMIYGVPEGTYKKGSMERDACAKHVFFSKIFGAYSGTVRDTIWEQARLLLPFDEVEKFCWAFDEGYTGLAAMYEMDKYLLGQSMLSEGQSPSKHRPGWGFCYDAYGRRRKVDVPPGAEFDGRAGTWKAHNGLYKPFHIAANTPTQSTNATDTMWMLALCHLGEYVELRVPPMWERGGIPFPEAAGWQLNGGAGPGGRPFQAWHMNTVHDSGWGDAAPGWMEPAAKLIWRRCRAVPLDWRLEADVPYRIDLACGPDMSCLMPYNQVAKRFGMEPVPDR